MVTPSLDFTFVAHAPISVMMARVFKLLILVCVVFASRAASASGSIYDVGAGMQYFAGETEKSLAPGTGTLVRLGAQSGEDVFRWVTNLIIMMGSGQTDFDDNGTSRELNYTLTGGEFDFGFGIYPLGSDSKLFLQPYLTATGSTLLASISFNKDATVSDEFPKSDSAMMFGFALGAGADWFMSKDWGIKIHVERSAVSGTMTGGSFSLGGHRLMVGLFFK